jgi:hypothetical protein
MNGHGWLRFLNLIPFVRVISRYEPPPSPPVVIGPYRDDAASTAQ